VSLELLKQGARVAPSLLSADYSRLGAQLSEVMDAGARVIHVDVMDGHFVPPITIGSLVVDSIATQVHNAGGHIDVHLMVERPERHVADFVSAGADSITIHQEATPHVHYTLGAIRDGGCAAGLALNPGTPPLPLDFVAETLDILLCMTVNPGWAGQPFIASSPEKVAAMRSRLPAGVAIEVDGGVTADTVRACASAGASLFVAGSAVFGSDEPAAAYERLAKAAGAV